MSGDLREPSRSIPVGTLAAVGTGYLVYMVLPIILDMRADATTLIEQPLVMKEIAFWGPAILLGVWGPLFQARSVVFWEHQGSYKL